MESSKNYIDKNVHIQKKTLLRLHVENIKIPTNFVKFSPTYYEMFTKFGGKKYLSTLGFKTLFCTVHRQSKISSENHLVKNIECAIKKLQNKFKQVQKYIVKLAKNTLKH